MLSIVAMLQVQNIFIVPSGKKKQSNKAKMQFAVDDDVTEAVAKCLISGFFAHAAVFHHSGVYKTVRENQSLHIHPTSVLYARKPPPLLLFNEVVRTTTAM